MPEIYIVEGPAGSGKSTIIDRLDTQNSIPIFDNSGDAHGVRNFDGYAGLIEITTRDLRKIGWALSTNIPQIIFDRWVLGSFVYDHLRGEAAFPDEQHFHHVIVGWLSIIKGLQGVLVARGRVPLMDIGIHWKLNLPSTETIDGRRTSANKGYPFPADLEHDAYWQVYRLLRDHIKEYPCLGDIRMSVQDIHRETWQW